MPAEVKQRKKRPSEDVSANFKQEELKVKNEVGRTRKSSSLDFKSIMCVLSLGVCAALGWAVLQQHERFSQMEEKLRLLHGKTSSLTQMEEQVEKITKKLAAAEDDLQETLSAISVATGLRQDVSTLHDTVLAMQADETSSSGDLQAVNARFLNVTETWQVRLAAAASELAALKAEAREAYTGSTEKVNEAERRLRALVEKLEELEDSTRRNARALERTEADDAKRAQDQLDWNTKQIHKLEENVKRLARKEAELSVALQEHIPRAQECEEHIPHVEEALRSILKLGGDLSGAEKRLEEVTLQVFGAEDSMLKTLNQILEMRQEVDALQARSSIIKMKSELSVCDDVRLLLDDVGTRSRVLQAQLENLDRDVRHLKEWASNLSEKRSERQVSLDALTGAVDQIEAKTSAITTDFGNKVASMRTDVRRMDGLRSELESLLTQVSQLEDRVSQAEHSMVKRIGDVLASSIDRVSNLRAASERNAQALEQLRRRLPEFDAADRDVSERLRELEGGRARLIRTVSFVGDLKPKVAAIKRDFSAFEPRLSDLTVRIGSLAEDIGKRGEETAELRRVLDNLTSVEDISDETEQAALLSEFKGTAQPI